MTLHEIVSEFVSVYTSGTDIITEFKPGRRMILVYGSDLDHIPDTYEGMQIYKYATHTLLGTAEMGAIWQTHV